MTKKQKWAIYLAGAIIGMILVEFINMVTSGIFGIGSILYWVILIAFVQLEGAKR